VILSYVFIIFKRSEDELKNYSENLEDIVKIKTSELARTITTLESEIIKSKLIEDTLRRSELQYHTVLQTALDGFWIIDLQGRFIEVNEAYCKIVGYSREELLGKTIQYVESLEKESLRKVGTSLGQYQEQRICKE
jgi:PAS domain-containing protein